LRNFLDRRTIGVVTPAARFRFVHLTDTHIMAGGGWRFRPGYPEFDTEQSLRRVVEAVRGLDPAPDFAVLGGDLASPDLLNRAVVLTSAEYEPSYELLKSIISGLPCPTHVLLGNHDDRGAFNRVLLNDALAPGASHCFSFDHGGYHFIGLDSQEPGQARGFLNSRQIEWLRHDLLQHRDQPTIVFVHHHPWPLGLEWIDGMRLRNGEELIGALHEHSAVRWLICGHVHLDQAIQRGGLTMLTTPSTCLQLSKVSQAAKALPGPPAFRIVDVSGDELSTRVVHLHATNPHEI
jgi:3',5'-cyclic-AMP phosphodiesterase